MVFCILKILHHRIGFRVVIWPLFGEGFKGTFFVSRIYDMEDKESHRDIGIVESRSLCIESDLENDEQATAAAVIFLPLDSTAVLIPSSSPSAKTSGDCSTGVYNNSHHSEVRRSSDDRDEDLLLERERTSRRHVNSPANFDDGDETHLTQPASLERRFDLSISSGSSSNELDIIAESFANLSLQRPSSPQQECDRHLNSQYVSGVVKEAKFLREGCVDVESFPSTYLPHINVLR